MASGIGTAIAACPGLNLAGTMIAGAVGSLTTDALKGNINNLENAGMSLVRGAAANGLGFVASKAVAVTKVQKISKMPRSKRKIYLRDNIFHNSQAMVNQNLHTFKNYSFVSKVTLIERRLPVLKSGIYSTLTSTIALLK